MLEMGIGIVIHAVQNNIFCCYFSANEESERKSNNRKKKNQFQSSGTFTNEIMAS